MENKNTITSDSMYIELKDDYILSGHINFPDPLNPNAVSRRSWWLTKRGFTDARYCFSTSVDPARAASELQYMLENIDGYIRMWENANGVISDSVTKQDAPFPASDSCYELSGGYLFLPTSTGTSSDGSYIWYAVSHEALCGYLRENNVAEDSFLSEFTSEEVDELVAYAMLKSDDGVAFSYCADRDEPFEVFSISGWNAMAAFLDVLSGGLQEAGYQDASKYIDALFDL